MKEYQILLADDLAHAEQVMNDMAKSGWSVAATSLWSPGLIKQLAITFEREAQ